MNKYPVLSRMSLIAKVAGWIAFPLAGLICLIGLAHVLGSIISVPANSGDAYFNLWRGTGLLMGGSGLLLGSLILIVTSEMVHVFIDIEHNTFESARAALSTVHPTPAQTAAASVRQDRRESNLLMSETVPVDDDSWSARPGDLATLSVVQDIISLAKEQGYTVRARDTYVVFTKDGRNETCYNVGHVRRFGRVANLIGNPDESV